MSRKTTNPIRKGGNILKEWLFVACGLFLYELLRDIVINVISDLVVKRLFNRDSNK